jgi:thiosulfate/3-mercaptopyruvate sulfurtransferase
VCVVTYGSMGGAERLWWLLRHFGHDECGVLVGGLEAWGGELRAGEEQIEPTAFRPRERSGDTIEADEIARRDDLVVVDARLESRWRGEPNPIDVVPGRVPGALNAPWNEPLADVPPGEVAAYCGSGVTSCVTIHRLWLAGRDGRLYPGSWSQWETLDLPVERG